MNKYLKDFIKYCPIQKSGIFSELMFISNGRYDGFYGKNGYDNIMILGKLPCCCEWRTVSNYGDAFILINESGYNMSLDINSKLKVPRIWFDGAYISIDNRLEISTVTGRLIPR